jgi:predicted  nucleic acid-binding Zn-ribbon protein
MSRISALFDLQQTDSRIDAANSRIAYLTQLLEDNALVESARQTVSEAEAALVKSRSSLKELEDAAQKLQQHANDLEKKLYGGQIKGNKEMAAAQLEIETFRQRKKETDDKTVEAMLGLEEAEATLKAAKESLVQAAKTTSQGQVNHRRERDELEAALVLLQVERAKRLKMVMPPDLPVYDKIRQQKQGVAVAEVMYGKMCGKCRVELPLAKQKEIKGGTYIVLCPSCGRILYHKF